MHPINTSFSHYEITIIAEQNVIAVFNVTEDSYAEKILRSMLHSGYAVSMVEKRISNKEAVQQKLESTDRMQTNFGQHLTPVWGVTGRPQGAHEAIMQDEMNRRVPDTFERAGRE